MNITLTQWEAAEARYEAARKAEADFYEQHMTPANERWKAFLAVWPYTRATTTDPEALARYDAASADVDSFDQQYTELVGALMEAEREIMATPAPDVKAMALKLKVFDRESEGCEPRDILAILRADIGRLAA